ncbi:hypothetical protein ACSBR1_038009 [Camellia fascicularis]
MTESVVLRLLANLAPFLHGEVNLLYGVREAMEDIIDEFERMLAFLRVADAKEENDPELKVQVFYFAKTLKAHHQIASEIQRIKSRVINISEGHKRYHDKYGILEQGSRPNVVNNSWSDYRGDALLLEEAKLVGIEKPKGQLIEWLIEGGSGFKVVFVVVMGGLGKTTLVKKVYDDAKVKKHFKIHAWLIVSESFKAEDILKDMIQRLFKEIMQLVPIGVETTSIDKLKYLVNNFLLQNRFVVVFNDVWNVKDWEAIQHMLPDKNCGSFYLL